MGVNLKIELRFLRARILAWKDIFVFRTPTSYPTCTHLHPVSREDNSRSKRYGLFLVFSHSTETQVNETYVREKNS